MEIKRGIFEIIELGHFELVHIFFLSRKSSPSQVPLILGRSKDTACLVQIVYAKGIKIHCIQACPVMTGITICLRKEQDRAPLLLFRHCLLVTFQPLLERSLVRDQGTDICRNGKGGSFCRIAIITFPLGKCQVEQHIVFKGPCQFRCHAHPMRDQALHILGFNAEEAKFIY